MLGRTVLVLLWGNQYFPAAFATPKLQRVVCAEEAESETV